MPRSLRGSRRAVGRMKNVPWFMVPAQPLSRCAGSSNHSHPTLGRTSGGRIAAGPRGSALRVVRRKSEQEAPVKEADKRPEVRPRRAKRTCNSNLAPSGRTVCRRRSNTCISTQLRSSDACALHVPSTCPFHHGAKGNERGRSVQRTGGYAADALSARRAEWHATQGRFKGRSGWQESKAARKETVTAAPL
jgi:hypothetical protein